MTIINPAEAAPPPYDGTGQVPAQNLDLKLTAQPSTRELLISLVPPSAPAPQGEKREGKRSPVDLCLVLDVSGSMSAAAPAPGENESSGLSVLDVVKHATRTIIESLDDEDRVSIVVFANEAEIITPLTHMTKAEKASSWKKVSELGTRGSTNLWDGLKTGLNVLTGRVGYNDEDGKATSSAEKADETAPRLHALFLLTDGQPNVEPPRGHLPSLDAYLDAIPANKPRPAIHTFGFGYELDSQLLDALAHRGGGAYGFMPDSGMVGTVFVHAVANVVCTWAASCEVSVELEPEAPGGVEVLGAFPVVAPTWGAKIQVGDILYGQHRDVVVRLPSSCFGPQAASRATVTVHYRPHSLPADSKPLTVSASVSPNVEREDSVDLRHHVFRLSFVRAIQELLEGAHGPQARLADAMSSCRAALAKAEADPALAAHAPAAALRTDIASQVLLAFEDAHWSRWGIHYLPSLARSHLRQQCSNFKDPGLQVYGAASAVFLPVRDALAANFENLPPPKPSRRVGRAGAVASMARWHSAAGPCFAGSCDVALADGSALRLDQLRAGMQVRTPNGPRAVVSLLRTACAGGVAELVSIGNLLVTPWHPVLRDGEWVFPAFLAPSRRERCDAVYSVLLERDADPNAHAVLVGGVWGVTLGHGSVEGVRQHEFLGNWDAVCKDMQGMREYEGRLGVLSCGGVSRDDETGRICGFVPEQGGESLKREEWTGVQMGPAAVAVC